ncbi:MBL fold metallo-hydrolase [Paralysiella testudinis]|uniref:MBL fold metallo-hydrolase n=1 Tax=Paralysiella testudinis TaxID=2809020 RepID=A0A892ZFT0_9NEIS|nr:MBL fold metallo-hydrolase [Paralysiella testudinis]QRQ81420.1 MBL fold metallo-hydrolase [Paralysiella testudinis]
MRFKTLALGLLSTLFGLTASLSAHAEVKYEHIRNATAKIHYGATTFLVDPYLADKGAYPGFEGTVNSEQRNPLINMGKPIGEVIQGIDAVIVTHTHPDHWDEAAQKALPKNIPIFAQNAGDAAIIRSQGFKDVRVLGKRTEFKGVWLSKTGGQHGTDQMYSIPALAELAGDAMGVVLENPQEKTLYIVGDTVWNEQVDYALNRYKPQIVVMNTGDAKLTGFKEGIIMGLNDVATMSKAAPAADIITVHMDAVNHTTVSTKQMRDFVKQQKLKRVFVPHTAQVLTFE